MEEYAQNVRLVDVLKTRDPGCKVASSRQLLGAERAVSVRALQLWWGWGMCIGTGQGSRVGHCWCSAVRLWVIAECGTVDCWCAAVDASPWSMECPAKFLEALIASEFNTNPSASPSHQPRLAEIDHHHTKDITPMR